MICLLVNLRNNILNLGFGKSILEGAGKNRKTRVLDLKTRVEPETRVLKKVGFSSITMNYFIS